ncbi:unnamed protein product, partial [Mesorhabditis spiculigera]
MAYPAFDELTNGCQEAMYVLRSFDEAGAMMFTAVGFGGSAAHAATTPKQVEVLLNTVKMKFPDAKPFQDGQGSVMVPIRFVSEALGAKVGIKSKDHTVDMTIGQTTATVDGQKKDYGTQIILKQNRTFVPLRLVSEGLGQKVEWDKIGRWDKQKQPHTLLAQGWFTTKYGAILQGNGRVMVFSLDPKFLEKNEEKENNGTVFAPKVEGWRYYFPTLFTIELEPDEGKAIIQHWTTNGQSKEYLVQNTFVEMSGICTYTVVVEENWTLTWKDPREVPTADGGTRTVYDVPRSKPDVRRPTYQVVRPYSYWAIDELSVYNIQKATLMQYAFSGEQINILPSGYEPPEFQAETTGYFYPANNPSPVIAPSRSKDGGTSEPTMDEDNLQSVAEAAIPDVQVENDSLIFKGQTIMNKQRVAKSGPQPVNIPAPGEIGKDVLYSPYNYIPSNKVNKKDEVSTGTIEFIMAAGSINTEEEELEYEINGINTVTVHTPVVNYSAVSDDQPHNQKTKPNMSRSALILDRPFIVRIPTSGQHLDVTQYPGYGNRDYAKYFRAKQVRFPFDVYTENKNQLIPKDTWINVPVDQLDTTFELPVWVDEGDYQVYFRNIAENAPVDYTYEQDANLNLANHAAVDQVSVEVIGRLYDFHITDIADYNWERVFRTYIGSKDSTGMSYWVGQNGIDGAPRGNNEPYTLPIRAGSNPLTGMKNVAVKTGYHFKFDFKTMGNMFGTKDGIRITTTFTYVSKDGGSPIPVDLYYKTNDQPFIKVGSPEDKVERYVILNERLRSVPQGDIKNAGYWRYDQYLTADQQAGTDRDLYMRNYVLKYTKKATPVGGYAQLLLPEQLKTLIGPKEIPSNATNGNLQNPHLQYINAPLMNQWRLEGYRPNILDSFMNVFNLRDGDIVFYNADQSSRDDFSAQAPH